MTQEVTEPVNPFLFGYTLELVKYSTERKFTPSTDTNDENHVESFLQADSLESNPDLQAFTLKKFFTVEKQQSVNFYRTNYDDRFFFKILKGKSLELFIYIMLHLEKNVDYIDLDYKKVCAKTGMSNKSFYKALADLKTNNIIADKEKSIYWINPHYTFFGDRKKLVVNTTSASVKIVSENLNGKWIS